MKEPVKYERSTKGTHWILTKEWKEWDRAKKGRVPNVSTKLVHPQWERIAYSISTGKEIYFCYCLRNRGRCGAVAVRDTRNSQLREVE